MSSAGLTPLPTSVHHSTTRLTHKEAHTFLSDFLERAENDAAYRPDSTLTERGPQALSSGSTASLTLSHLKRILQGMEGKKVGGPLKVMGEEGEEIVAQGNAEVSTELDEVGEAELSQQLQQKKKTGKRARDIGEEDEDPTPKNKKQKRKIISTADAERFDDPTGGAVLEPALPPSNQEGEDDWLDAETFALGQEEINQNDAAGPSENDEVVFEGAGQNDTQGDDELGFNEIDAANAVEADRHPGADLPQPKNRKEEKDFVSVRIAGTGEVADPTEEIEEHEGQKKKTKKSKKRKLRDETEDVKTEATANVGKTKNKKQAKLEDQNVDTPQTNGANGSQVTEGQDVDAAANIDVPKKQKKRKHKDRDGDVDVLDHPASSEFVKKSDDVGDGDTEVASTVDKAKKKKQRRPQPQDEDTDAALNTVQKNNLNSSQRSKGDADDEATDQALSKDEKKALKKLRQQESKKERQKSRMDKKR